MKYNFNECWADICDAPLVVEPTQNDLITKAINSFNAEVKRTLINEIKNEIKNEFLNEIKELKQEIKELKENVLFFQYVERPIEYPVEQPIEQFIEQPIEQFIEQPVEQPVEQPIEQPIKKYSEVLKSGINSYSSASETYSESNSDYLFDEDDSEDDISEIDSIYDNCEDIDNYDRKYNNIPIEKITNLFFNKEVTFKYYFKEKKHNVYTNCLLGRTNPRFYPKLKFDLDTMKLIISSEPIKVSYKNGVYSSKDPEIQAIINKIKHRYSDKKNLCFFSYQSVEEASKTNKYVHCILDNNYYNNITIDSIAGTIQKGKSMDLTFCNSTKKYYFSEKNPSSPGSHYYTYYTKEDHSPENVV
jgi:hypothetical protein